MRVANFVANPQHTFHLTSRNATGYTDNPAAAVSQNACLNKSVLLEPAISREGFGFIA